MQPEDCIFFLLFIQVEHPVHKLPFLSRRRICICLLEDCHIGLPFFLSRQGSHTRHGCIPIEIERGFNNHKQTSTQNINLHFQNAYFADCSQCLRPYFTLRMSSAVLCHKFCVILQTECLTISLHRTMVLLNAISCLLIFHI